MNFFRKLLNLFKNKSFVSEANKMPTINRGIEIANLLLKQIPDGITNPDNDVQRSFVRAVAEQLYYETEDSRWGVKSALPTRPQGPSQIAYNSPDGLGGWRIVEQGGTPQAEILPNPPYQSFVGQDFIPVQPINHFIVRVPEFKNKPTDKVVELLTTIKDSVGELIDIVKSIG